MQVTSQILDERGNQYVRDIDAKTLELIFARETKASASGNALKASIWNYAAITLNATAFSQLSVSLWRRGSTSGAKRGRKPGWEQVYADPILDLMEKPNAKRYKSSFLEDWMIYLLDGGNVWMHTEGPIVDGVPQALYLYGRNQVEPLRKSIKDPLLGWRIHLRSDLAVDFPPDQLDHWRLPNAIDSVMGLNPLEVMRTTVDANFSRAVHDAAFWKRAASPSMILKHKRGGLDKEARDAIRESFSEMQNASNAGAFMVLGEDFDVVRWGIEHSQSQFIESEKLDRDKIATMYTTPVALMNSEESGGLGKEKLEQSEVLLYLNNIVPRAIKFMEPLNERIVKVHNPRYFMQLDVDRVPVLINAQLDTKSQILKRLVSSYVPPNDAIELLDINLDPFEGGDTGYVPQTLIPLDGQSDTSDGEGDATPVVAVKPIAKKVATKQPGRLIGMDPLSLRLRAKAKRFLFDVKSDVLRDSTRFVGGLPEDMRREWIRLCLPVSAAAMQLGYEEAERDHNGGGPTWLDRLAERGNEAIDAGLTDLQRRVEEIQMPVDMRDECRLQVARSAETMNDVARALSTAVETRDGYRDATRGLDRAAKAHADLLVRFSKNAGRYLALRDMGKNVNGDPCTGGRYAGDGRLVYNDVAKCQCDGVVVVEGES